MQTFVVPDLGDFEDVEVIEVHISNGDNIDVEDPLVTLETDKAAMDVPAIVAGRIESVLVKVGDKVSSRCVTCDCGCGCSRYDSCRESTSRSGRCDTDDRRSTRTSSGAGEAAARIEAARRDAVN